MPPPITGKPALPAAGTQLPFAEKLNVIANLMDVLPDDSVEELVPVGFAEGRCDVFRVEALRAVGFYDTHLRVSGEDQVLAAKLRGAGWEIWQAPKLVYHLSVSGEQDSVAKLVRHQRLFGRTDPVHPVRGAGQPPGPARAGAPERTAGVARCCAARRWRPAALYALALAALAVGWSAACGAAAGRRGPRRASLLYRRHAAAVRLSALGGAAARARPAAAGRGVYRGTARGLLVPRARRARPARSTSLRSGGPRSPSFGSEADLLLDEVQRPLLALLVDPPDVLADEAERDELHAAQEERSARRRSPSRAPSTRGRAGGRSPPARPGRGPRPRRTGR